MQPVLEAVGAFAFATSGAVLAVRRGFDVIGILMLAVLTAIGGGVLRDVILGATPPTALTRWPFYAAPIAAAVATFFFSATIERLGRLVLLFDAAGLGVFCVAGTVKALDYGLGPVPAVALGVTTGVGGGLLRDVVARETPVLFRADSELYAIPAIAGCLAVAVVYELGAYGPVAAVVCALAIFGVRLAALVRGWRAPTAWRAPRG